MKKYNYQQGFRKYRQHFIDFNDEQLIKGFNVLVGLPYCGLPRAAFQNALLHEIYKRGIDMSNVDGLNNISFKYAITLKDKKVYRLWDLPHSDTYEVILNFLYTKFGTRYDLSQHVWWNNDEVGFMHPEFQTEITFNANKIFKKI